MKRRDGLTNKELEELTFELVMAFSSLKGPLEAASFTQDLLTSSEVNHLAKRLRIAKLISQGFTYKQIEAALKVSSVTITKVATWFNEAGEGFRKVIERLPEKPEFNFSDISEFERFQARYSSYFPFSEVNLKRFKSTERSRLAKKISKIISKLDRKSEIYYEIQKVFEEEAFLKR